MITTDVEYESISGHIWKLSAEGIYCAPEPDVGIMHPWVEYGRLFWTNTGKELSRTAYNKVAEFDCLSEAIDEALLEAAGIT